MASVIERIIEVAGQDFDSPECRVNNPRITARESIELADYIVALRAERDALAAKAALLNGLLEEMQERASKFLQPDGDLDNDFISFILETLDGPKQRVAQAPTSHQHIAEIRAEAGRAGYLQALEDSDSRIDGYYARTVAEDEAAANKYAAKVRKGGEQ